MEHPYLELSPDGKTVTGLKKLNIKEVISEIVIPDYVTTIAKENRNLYLSSLTP